MSMLWYIRSVCGVVRVIHTRTHIEISLTFLLPFVLHCWLSALTHRERARRRRRRRRRLRRCKNMFWRCRFGFDLLHIYVRKMIFRLCSQYMCGFCSFTRFHTIRSLFTLFLLLFTLSMRFVVFFLSFFLACSTLNFFSYLINLIANSTLYLLFYSDLRLHLLLIIILFALHHSRRLISFQLFSLGIYFSWMLLFKIEILISVRPIHFSIERWTQIWLLNYTWWMTITQSLGYSIWYRYSFF